MSVQRMLVTVLVCVCHALICSGWTDETYPNPQTDPSRCGRSRPGWICDPDRLLTTSQANDVNSELQKLHDLPNVCICELCPSSLKMAVALINRVDFTYRNTKDSRQKQKEFAVFSFAHRLRILEWRFKGQCLNDGLIFVTRDGELNFDVGRDAGYDISWECRKHIEKIGQQHFSSRRFYEGLIEMIKTMRKHFETGRCIEDNKTRLDKSTAITVGGIVGAVIVVVLFCCICTIVCYVKRRNAMNTTTSKQGARYHTAPQGGATVVVGAPPPPAYNEAYPATNPQYHKPAY